MSIITEIAITILVAAVVAFLLYKFYAFMLTPVKMGKDADICTVLRLKGDCPDVEQTIDGLIWLRGNGILKSKIIIVDCGMNPETRELAEQIVKRHSYIALCGINDMEFLGEI